MVVGSSYRMHSGWAASARAIATLALHAGGEIRGKQIAHGLYSHHVEQAVNNLVDLLFIEVAALAQGEGHVLANA